MGGPDVKLETAGGLNMPDHPIGTDAVLVMEAIDRAWSDDGVLVLMDLGSAVLSAEMALDLMPEERRANVLLCEAPIVEGAVAAAVTSKLGASLDRVAQEARGGLAGKMAHLGDTGRRTGGRARRAPGGRRGDDPADRDRAARPPRPARGALRPDGIVVRCARHDPRPDERPGSGGCGQPERRGDARGDAGARGRGRGQRTASVRGAGRDPRLGGARLRRPAGAERGARRRNAGRRTLARRAGRLGDRARTPRLAGHRDRSRPAVPDARPAHPGGTRGGRRRRARRVRRRARGRPGRDRASARARRGDGDRRRGRDLRRAPAVPEGRRAPRADPGRDRGRRPIGRAGLARRDRTDGGAVGRARGRRTCARERPTSGAWGDRCSRASSASRSRDPSSRRPAW